MRVDVFACDQCGERGDAGRFTRLWASCEAIHGGANYGLGGAQGGAPFVPQPLIHVEGPGRSAAVKAADLCSPKCAGEWLFGIKREVEK